MLIILVFGVVLVRWMISCNSIDVQVFVFTLCRWLECLVVFWILKYIITIQFKVAFYVWVDLHACWVWVFICYFHLRIERLLIILSQNILSLAWFFSEWLIYIVNFRVLIKYFFLINNHFLTFEINFLWVVNIIFQQIDFLRNRISSLLKLIKMLTVGRIHVWIIILNLNFFFYFYNILPNIFYLLSVDFILISVFIGFGLTRICLIHFQNFLNCNRVS